MSIEIRDGWLVETGDGGDLIAIRAERVSAVARCGSDSSSCIVYWDGADDGLVIDAPANSVLDLVLDWQRKQHIYGPFRPGEVVGIHMEPYPPEPKDWRKKTDDGDGGAQHMDVWCGDGDGGPQP